MGTVILSPGSNSSVSSETSSNAAVGQDMWLSADRGTSGTQCIMLPKLQTSLGLRDHASLTDNLQQSTRVAVLIAGWKSDKVRCNKQEQANKHAGCSDKWGQACFPQSNMVL